MLRLPPATTHRRFESALRADGAARSGYNRLRVMLERMGESDVLRLYEANGRGGYDVAEWIDRGVLPGGGRDPLYSFRSDATKKNHLTTLVMMSTPGKRCDALASRVPEGAREHFRSRLAGLSRSLRERRGGGAAGGPPAAEASAAAAAAPALLTWADVVRAYRDEERMPAPGMTRDDVLILDWWLAGGDEFPPKRHHFGNVVVCRGRRRPGASGEGEVGPDRLYFRGDSAVLVVSGRKQEERLPPELARKVRQHLDADAGEGNRWRKWLFQSKSGRPRPVEDSAFGHRVKCAFGRLTGSGLGINRLVTMYRRHVESCAGLSEEARAAILGRMMLGRGGS